MSKWGAPSKSAAAAAAAALNAKLQAQGVVKPAAAAVVAPAPVLLPQMVAPPPPMEVEINDAPNRAELTRKPFHQMIMSEYNVAVTMRGRWYRPGEKKPSMTDSNKPLHLYIEPGEGADHTNIAKAVEKITESLTRPTAETDGRSAGGGGGGPPGSSNGGKMVEKLWLHLAASPDFDIPAKMCGDNDSFLEYIESASQSTSVSLRGRGASAGPPSIRRQDSMEMLHVYIEHTSREGMHKACELAQKLIEQVQVDYRAVLGSRGAAPQHGGGYGMGGPQHGYGMGGPPPPHGGYQQHQYPHYPQQYPPPHQQYYQPQYQTAPAHGYGYHHPPPPQQQQHQQYNQAPHGYQYPPPSFPHGAAPPIPPPVAAAGAPALPVPPVADASAATTKPLMTPPALPSAIAAAAAVGSEVSTEGAAAGFAGPPPPLPPPSAAGASGGAGAGSALPSTGDSPPPQLPPHAGGGAGAGAGAGTGAGAGASAGAATSGVSATATAAGSTAGGNNPPQLPPPPARRSFQEKVSLAPPPRPPAGADMLQGERRERPARETEDLSQDSAAKKVKLSLVDYDDADE